MIMKGRSKNILNGRSEIFTKCRHVIRVGYYQLIYGKSEKNNCLVNFQAFLLISSGEISANRDIFFTEDAAKNFFPTSKISAQEIRHQFFLI